MGQGNFEGRMGQNPNNDRNAEFTHGPESSEVEKVAILQDARALTLSVSDVEDLTQERVDEFTEQHMDGRAPAFVSAFLQVVIDRRTLH